jgi:hypothetical protein
VLATGSTIERQAAALALHACPDAKAKELLAAAPDLAAAIEDGRLSWQSLSQQL